MKLRTYCALDLHFRHTVFEAQGAGGAVIGRRGCRMAWGTSTEWPSGRSGWAS